MTAVDRGLEDGRTGGRGRWSKEREWAGREGKEGKEEEGKEMKGLGQRREKEERGESRACSPLACSHSLLTAIAMCPQGRGPETGARAT